MPHPQRQIVTAICRFALALTATLGLSLCLTTSANAVLLASQPSVVVRPNSQIEDVVARGADGHVYYKSFNGSQWLPWVDLGGNTIGRPAALSYNSNHLDIYARDTNKFLMHKYWTGTQWSNWEPIGGAWQLQGDPQPVSWANGRVDVFARGMDGALIHAWFGGTWSAWESLGGVLSTDPTPISYTAGHLDIYGLGSNSALFHKTYWGGWTGWSQIGAWQYTTQPAVSWWNNGSAQQVNVYARGTDGRLNENWWTSLTGAWTLYGSQGGDVLGQAATATMGWNQLDLFVRGTDSTLYNKSCCYPGWTGWVRRGPSVIPLGSDPDAVGWPGHMDVFALDTGGGLIHSAYYDGSWHDWDYLDKPGGVDPYPTSVQYGGYDRSVNTDAELRALRNDLTKASDSTADSLLYGLSDGDLTRLKNAIGDTSVQGPIDDPDAYAHASGASWHWGWWHKRKDYPASQVPALLNRINNATTSMALITAVFGVIDPPSAVLNGISTTLIGWYGGKVSVAASGGTGVRTDIGFWCKNIRFAPDLCYPKISVTPL